MPLTSSAALRARNSRCPRQLTARTHLPVRTLARTRAARGPRARARGTRGLGAPGRGGRTNTARRAWIGYAERLARCSAPLAGAQRAEVVAMNSLSVNLHLLLASFYRPTADAPPHPHRGRRVPVRPPCRRSQIRWHGYDPASALLELAPRAGEELLRQEDIEARIAAEGEALALVLWPGVQYRTGQSFELARASRAARIALGARVGFDLAHSIGNLPLALHDERRGFRRLVQLQVPERRARARSAAPSCTSGTRAMHCAAAPRGLVGARSGHALPA